MKTLRTLLIIATLSSMALVLPSVASAENGPSATPWNGFPVPDISGLNIPTWDSLPSLAPGVFQQVPGGYMVNVPGYPSVMIPNPSGVWGNGMPAPSTGGTPWEPMPSAQQPTNPWGYPTPTPAPAPTQPTNPWGYPTPTPAPTQPPSVVVPPTPAPAPGPAAPSAGTGRVVGVFAGITNYQSGSDLPHCADDARNLAQAFIQAGIIAQADAIVLTDHQATRRNLFNAVQQLSSRIGTNDTLVVFFSGHGDQRPDTNGDELDGQDETIILNDGPLVDDEMVNLLRGARGRDLLALDSCYSGGFERDLATIPQSIGFYASREDQLSYVASEFGAGGYLSHFMRTGVAASRGRQLQVGTLRQHIQQGFMSSSANGRQDLVVGVGQGSTMATVIYNPSNAVPARVAAR